MKGVDPVTARWLSNDPIGISGGLNQYVFCGGNPVMFVDPEGDEPKYAGGSGDIYRPDPFGHGKNAMGQPIDPHVDRITSGGVKFRYDIDGVPRTGAPSVSKRDLGAFRKALEKVNKIVKGAGGRASSFIIYLPGVFEDIDRYLRAKKCNESYEDQLRKDLAPYPYIDTPFGLFPNPFYNPNGVPPTT